MRLVGAFGGVGCILHLAGRGYDILGAREWTVVASLKDASQWSPPQGIHMGV